MRKTDSWVSFGKVFLNHFSLDSVYYLCSKLDAQKPDFVTLKNIKQAYNIRYIYMI